MDDILPDHRSWISFAIRSYALLNSGQRQEELKEKKEQKKFDRKEVETKGRLIVDCEWHALQTKARQ